jgi:putative ABC transport system ATP-binding protein
MRPHPASTPSPGAPVVATRARLEALHLVVERQGRRLLDGLSLRLDEGTVASIEGASGSGKTTLLRALSTLIPIFGGRILLDGEDAQALAPTLYRRRVALVPQQPPMLEGTVADNVATGPRLRGEALGERETSALLERVGLSLGFAARPARELSGGERHRVALARALANEPRVLLLDEPTAALDPASAARVLDLVRALAGEGLAVAVVTHVEEHAQILGGARYRCEGGRLSLQAEAP